MRHTANETSTHTLTRLIKALDAKHPVTVTYVKADGTETIRTIEIHDVIVTAAGDIVLRAMDRETGEARSWRLDRIVSYTVHRTAYVVARPAAPTEPAVVTAAYELATSNPTNLPTATRINNLAAAFAA
jgi:predicted DNA-binding transcriptional regulator YafY